MECPGDSTFSAYAASELAASERARLEGHAAECIGCHLVLGALRSRASTCGLESGASAPMDTTLDGYVARIAEHARLTALPGSRVGRYLVQRAVGAGAMGIVYAAHDPELDRTIALKLLREGQDEARGRLKKRVQNEARAMARLAHPNVVAVYDVGTSEDDEVYVAMELVDGDTLAEWLRHDERDWRAILRLFRGVAHGLAAAHAVGLVHRDLKPQNILVGRDQRARITDFGLARFTGAADGGGAGTTARGAATSSQASIAAGGPSHGAGAGDNATTASVTAEGGTLVGTPAYMAPEQLRYEAADALSDQYAFCMCLYEALYRRRAYEAISPRGEDATLVRPAEAHHVPPRLFDVLARGLANERSARFPSMKALVEALDDASAAFDEEPATLEARARATLEARARAASIASPMAMRKRAPVRLMVVGAFAAILACALSWPALRARTSTSADSSAPLALASLPDPTGGGATSGSATSNVNAASGSATTSNVNAASGTSSVSTATASASTIAPESANGANGASASSASALGVGGLVPKTENAGASALAAGSPTTIAGEASSSRRAPRSAPAAGSAALPSNRGVVPAPSSSALADLLGRRY